MIARIEQQTIIYQTIRAIMIYMSMCDEHFIVPGTNKKKDQFITHAHTHTHTPNEHH